MRLSPVIIFQPVETRMKKIYVITLIISDTYERR